MNACVSQQDVDNSWGLQKIAIPYCTSQVMSHAQSNFPFFLSSDYRFFKALILILIIERLSQKKPRKSLHPVFCSIYSLDEDSDEVFSSKIMHIPLPDFGAVFISDFSSMRALMRFLVAKSCKFYFLILEQFYLSSQIISNRPRMRFTAVPLSLHSNLQSLFGITTNLWTPIRFCSTFFLNWNNFILLG